MRRFWRRGVVPDDGGSILPLTVGVAALALTAVLVCTDATSMYLAQKQLDAVADAAALAGADGFSLSGSGDDVRAGLTDDGVRTQAADYLVQVDARVRLVSAASPDGTSARVRVAVMWHPPVLTVFVPDGVALQATGTSRTALR